MMEREEWNENRSETGKDPEILESSDGGNSENHAEEYAADGEAQVDYSLAAGKKEDVRRSSMAWSSSDNQAAWGGFGDQAKNDNLSGSTYGNVTGGNENPYENDSSYKPDIEDSRKDDAYTSDSMSGIPGGTGNMDGIYQNPPKKKKSRKALSKRAKGGIAIVLALILCFGAGFGGGALALNVLGDNGGSRSTSNISIDASESGMDAASVIAEKVMPSVVGISTVSPTYTQSIFGVTQGVTEGSGTGFIVDENGYILTNSHVVENGESGKITVDLYDGSEYEGTVLWSDSSLDLAIVKIDAKNLQAVDLGDSDDVKIGDYAVAIGNPLGRDFERSVTQGIISGLDRSITTTDAGSQKQNSMQGLIQTDASINSGNSGGPLINSSGEVIGINTAKASSAEGLGFAIPINTAVPVIQEIKENGTYEQVSLGVVGMNLEAVIAQYETDFAAEKGVYVAQIYTGSAAANAGMKEGDIITALNGEKIENMSDLKKQLVKYRPGDKVTITVERSKEQQTLDVTLQALDSSTQMKYKSSSDSGSQGSSGGSQYGGQSGDGSYDNSQGYGDLFGGIFGN